MTKGNHAVWGTCVFILLGFVVGILKPFSGLDIIGHTILASVVIAMSLWIFRPGDVPYTAGGLVILATGLISGLKYNVVASGFVSSALWILIPALYFGFVLQKTGLGKRIAYLVLKFFKPSWFSITISWFIIGIILSALTPSITVRISIVMPIALSIVEACRLDFRSQGSALITLMAATIALLPGNGWLTGSLWGPIMLGFLPAELKPLATFNEWFKIMALPWFMITIFFIILIYLILKPNDKIKIPRDAFKKQYESLGQITRQEIITALVLLGTLVLFATERLHGIPSAATAIIAFCLLIMFKIITVSEISTGVSWDIIIFFGITISLSSTFVAARISDWIGPILEPYVLPLAPNHMTFLIVITFALWVIRLVDVSWGFSTIAITVNLLIPLFNQYGIHPLVPTMAYLIAGNCFFLMYQQPHLLVADGIIQCKGWSIKHISIAGLVYSIAAITSLLLSVPYWKAIGVLK